MKRRYATIGMALIATIALISTAIAGGGIDLAQVAKKPRRGPAGPAGATGPAGPSGPQGAQGIPGAAGTPATRLQACVALDGTLCTATEGANIGLNGAVTHTGGTGTYVVHFNQSTVGCNAFAQESLLGEATAGAGSPGANDVTVTTGNSAGAAAERGFRLAVFC